MVWWRDKLSLIIDALFIDEHSGGFNHSNILSVYVIGLLCRVSHDQQHSQGISSLVQALKGPSNEEDPIMFSIGGLDNMEYQGQSRQQGRSKKTNSNPSH